VKDSIPRLQQLAFVELKAPRIIRLAVRRQKVEFEVKEGPKGKQAAAIKPIE
jgi:hypothetical protein